MMQGKFRLRVKWRKVGRLRYLSHLEVLRAQERMIRRAKLPYCVTEGFSPHMKLAFGSALSCGTAGLDEYLDVWIKEYLPEEQLLQQMQSSCAEDLKVLDCWYVPDKEPALDVQLKAARYSATITVPYQEADSSFAAGKRVIEAEQVLFNQGYVKVIRKKKEKTVSLSEHLIFRISVTEVQEDATGYAVAVEFTTCATDTGSLRPDLYLGGITGGINGSKATNFCRLQQLQEENGTFIPLEKPSAINLH